MTTAVGSKNAALYSTFTAVLLYNLERPSYFTMESQDMERG